MAHGIEAGARNVEAKSRAVRDVDRGSLVGLLRRARSSRITSSREPSGLLPCGLGKSVISLLFESGTTVPMSADSAAVALRRSTKPVGHNGVGIEQNDISATKLRQRPVDRSDKTQIDRIG